MQKVIEYYRNYDEETRLIRHKTEFAVTTWVLDDLIKNRQNILDTAAGTGAYAAYYAGHGCMVEAMDIVPWHIETLQKKYGFVLNLKSGVGDSRDLVKYQDGSFDVVFNMGAIYHIEEPEARPCILENLRVLKPGGILAISYVNKFEGFGDDNYFLNSFKCYSPFEIKRFFKETNTRELAHIPVDGESFSELNRLTRDNGYRVTGLQHIEERKPGFNKGLGDFHFWLDNNYLPENIYKSRKKFIHGLYVARKL